LADCLIALVGNNRHIDARSTSLDTALLQRCPRGVVCCLSVCLSVRHE